MKNRFRKNDPVKMVITGELGVGKSTLLREALDNAPVPVDGLITEPILSENIRTGFSIRRWGQNHSVQFAKLVDNSREGIKRYRIESKVFDDQGVKILRRALDGDNLIVIDELGLMERDSKNYLRMVEKIFLGANPVIFVVQKRALAFYQQMLQAAPHEMLLVEAENHHQILSKIFQSIARLSNQQPEY